MSNGDMGTALELERLFVQSKLSLLARGKILISLLTTCSEKLDIMNEKTNIYDEMGSEYLVLSRVLKETELIYESNLEKTTEQLDTIITQQGAKTK